MTGAVAQRLAALRGVFGDCVPQDPTRALEMLEQSPAAPASPAERAALRDAVIALAGARLDDGAHVERLAGAPPPSSTASRPLPAAMSLRLQEAARAKDAASPDGLKRRLDLAEADAVFGAAATSGIPWGFVADGCMFRAHVLAKRLEDQGVFSEKVLCIPRGDDLVIQPDKSRTGLSVVWFHVAVVVHVTEADGSPGRRVIDPSVADGCVTVDEWMSRMRGAQGKPVERFFLPRFAFDLKDREAPPGAWRDDDLTAARAYVDGDWRLVEKSYEDMGYFDDPMKFAAGG